jgi:hypothetical protein
MGHSFAESAADERRKTQIKTEERSSASGAVTGMFQRNSVSFICVFLRSSAAG